ncbi:MAG: PEGA domain-containing protein [Candidatus Falkowbacteria bacterium]
MTLKQRRLLYILFIGAFLTLAPAISFYAAGYDFNFQNGQVRRTGILIIETKPKDATVNLGNKKKYNWLYDFFYGDGELKTPLKLRNLLPDEYDIILSKEGYFNYQRKLKIESGQTMFLEDILLFKESYPELVSSDSINAIKASPDQKKLVVLTGSSLIIINMDNGKINKFPLGLSYSPYGQPEIVWAPSSKKVLLTYGNYPIYNIESGLNEVDVQKYFSGAITQVRWDFFSDNKVYVQHNNIIHQFNLAQKKATLLMNKKIANDFLVKDSNLFMISQDNKGDTVDIYNHQNGELIKSISVPNSSQYEFMHFDQKLIYLKDKVHDILYIINPWSLLPIQDVINNVREFSVNGDQILYWNDFEIWSYDINNKIQILVTRISEKIDQALWHSSGRHVIYNTKNGFNVIELENNSYLSLTKILDWQNTSLSAINVDNEFIYFTSPLKNGQGVYRLKIK